MVSLNHGGAGRGPVAGDIAEDDDDVINRLMLDPEPPGAAAAGWHNQHQPAHSAAQQQRGPAGVVNVVGPPPDLVRPAAVDLVCCAAAAEGHGAPAARHAAADLYQAVAAPPSAFVVVAGTAGFHRHVDHRDTSPAAAAAAVGCQVCGAALPRSPAVVQNRAESSHQHYLPAPPPFNVGPAAVVQDVADLGDFDDVPLPMARHQAAAAAVQPAGAIVDPPPAYDDIDAANRRLQQIVDPLPDLINTHRAPPPLSSSPVQHQHLQQSAVNPHHVYHRHHQFNLIQQQQQQQPAAVHGIRGAEMMMFYDDPSRCCMPHCNSAAVGGSYRCNPNNLVQFASSGVEYAPPAYQRTQNGSVGDGGRLCRANRASKLCDASGGWCFRCVVAMTTVRWIMVAMASLGVGCIVIGIVLGIVQIASTGGTPFHTGYLAHSLTFMGLGATLVSVVAVVWRCALPEAERRQSCRLLASIELADRVRWPSAAATCMAGRPSPPPSARHLPASGQTAPPGASAAGGGLGGPRAALLSNAPQHYQQQQQQQLSSGAPSVAGGAQFQRPAGTAAAGSLPPTASRSVNAAAAAAEGGAGGGGGRGSSSDYDYGYWCGGGQLCPEYRHPHNHHRCIPGRPVNALNSPPQPSSLLSGHQNQPRSPRPDATAAHNATLPRTNCSIDHRRTTLSSTARAGRLALQSSGPTAIAAAATAAYRSRSDTLSRRNPDHSLSSALCAKFS